MKMKRREGDQIQKKSRYCYHNYFLFPDFSAYNGAWNSSRWRKVLLFHKSIASQNTLVSLGMFYDSFLSVRIFF